MIGDGFGRHTPVLAGQYAVRALVIDLALVQHIGDALEQLTGAYSWLEHGDPVDDITQAAYLTLESYHGDIMIGSVSAFLGSPGPGWLLLDGSTYDQDDYPELVSKLDAVFLNDPTPTFTLPNLDDSFLAGAGGSYSVGDSGGVNAHQLTLAEMPAHTHTYTFPVVAPDTIGAGPPLPSVGSVTPGTPTGSAGSDQAHENRPPYLAVNWAVFAGRTV